METLLSWRTRAVKSLLFPWTTLHDFPSSLMETTLHRFITVIETEYEAALNNLNYFVSACWKEWGNLSEYLGQKDNNNRVLCHTRIFSWVSETSNFTQQLTITSSDWQTLNEGWIWLYDKLIVNYGQQTTHVVV